MRLHRKGHLAQYLLSSLFVGCEYTPCPRNRNFLFFDLETLCGALTDVLILKEFGVKEASIVKYLEGALDLRVLRLRRRKGAIKGRILGTRGKVLRSVMVKTRTSIFVHRYSFLIVGQSENTVKALEVLKKLSLGRGYGTVFRDL